MATVRPFAGIRYDPTRLDDPASVLDEADRWEQTLTSAPGDAPDTPSGNSPPYHVSHLYPDWMGSTAAAWLQEGRLVQDPPGCLYVYRYERPVPPGYRLHPGAPESARVVGLMAEVDVSSSSPVRIAEQVDPAAVERLVPAVKAFAFDLAPAWGFISPSGAAGSAAWGTVRAKMDSPPLLEMREADGAVHALWRLEAAAAESVAASLDGAPVAVVAGARRVAALRQAAGRSPSANGPGGRALMVLVPVEGDNSVVPALLPVHRLLLASAGIPPTELEQRVARFFRVLEPSSGEGASLQAVFQELGSMRQEFTGFVMYTGRGRFRLVRSKGRMFMENWTHPLGRAAWRSMDVNVLHALVFERALGLPLPDSRLSRPPVALEVEAARAVERVDTGEAVAAFLLPAPSPAQLYQAALDNNPIPAGAVRLWPPPLAGLLFRRRR